MMFSNKNCSLQVAGAQELLNTLFDEIKSSREELKLKREREIEEVRNIVVLKNLNVNNFFKFIGGKKTI